MADKILKLCVLEEFAAVTSSHSSCQLVIRGRWPGKLVVLLSSGDAEFGLARAEQPGSLLSFDSLADCISTAMKATGMDYIRFEEIDLDEDY